MSRVTLTLLAAGLLAAPACSKYQTQAKTSMEATAPLVITFEDDTYSSCDEVLCFLAIAKDHDEVGGSVKLAENSRMVRLLGDGSWTLYAAGEVPEKEEEPEAPEDWESQPIEPPEQRRAENIELKMGNAVKEVLSGSLVEVDGRKVLEIPPDQLPADDFMLYTNGWFGAMYGDEPISSPQYFGVTKIDR